jgi:hypothetical protein
MAKKKRSCARDDDVDELGEVLGPQAFAALDEILGPMLPSWDDIILPPWDIDSAATDPARGGKLTTEMAAKRIAKLEKRMSELEAKLDKLTIRR